MGTPRSVWLIVLVLLLVASSPSAGQTEKTFRIEKGGKRAYNLAITNDCEQPTTWQVKLKNLKPARVLEPGPRLTIPPESRGTFKIELDSGKARRKKVEGELIARCLDCNRCKLKGPGKKKRKVTIKILIIDLESFRSQAESFLARADLPVRLVDLTVVGEVRGDDIRTAARQLISSATILSETGWPIEPPGEDDETALEPLVDELLASGSVKPGQVLVRARWELESGGGFETLAAANDNGRVTWEPLHHFSSFELLETPKPRRGSWKLDPWRRTRVNGFGKTCLDVRWKVKVETAGCRINDELKSHVVIKHESAPCWGWEQKTLQGETGWCRGQGVCGPECPAGDEMCIKWAVVSYLALGLTRIEFDSANATLEEYPELKGRVTFDRSSFGDNRIDRTVEDLCAINGPID